MPTLSKGLLIAIEGIDGSGKSTLAKSLYEYLSTHEYNVLLTREPGGTPLGKKLRELLQHQTTPLDPKAEYLLFAADRAQHMSQLVLPHLQKKYIVISDRMADSSLAYQGFGRGLSKQMIATINTWAQDNRTPDITIYVDTPLEIALQRLQSRNSTTTTFEEKKEFMQKVHDGFAQMYANRDNVISIPGDNSPEEILQITITKIEQWILKHSFLQK